MDQAHHQVLVRLDDGAFRVVAGNGTVGVSGDGGPATSAALAGVTDMAFAPDGDLYLADGNRVRVIDTRGTIETVAGNGGPTGNGEGTGTAASAVAAGTPALTAALGPVGSVAVGPSGTLYLTTSSQILTVNPNGALQPVTALTPANRTVFGGTGMVPLASFGQIAVGAEGDIYASSLALGWSVYEISPEGTAAYLGAARRSGGNMAIVQLGPHGDAYAGNGSFVLRAEGGHLVRAYRLTGVPGIPESYFLDYFTFAPDGTLYADNLGESAFNRRQELVSMAHGQSSVLWSHPNH